MVMLPATHAQMCVSDVINLDTGLETVQGSPLLGASANKLFSKRSSVLFCSDV
jgi:hypothetical protein